MRRISLPKTFVVTLSLLALLGVVPVDADPPTAVSPGGVDGAMIQSRCPTFSWSGTNDGKGYELAVYRIEEVPGRDDADQTLTQETAATELVTRIQLPAGTTGWTPSMSQCLEWGGNYAWTVRAMNDAEPRAWSEASIFRVTGTPSANDAEAAIETLKRYLGEKGTAEADRRVSQRVAPQATRTETARGAVGSIQRSESWSQGSRTKEGLPGAALESETVSAAATAPSLDSPSLSVDGGIALGQDSNLFKRGDVLLWDDYLGNLALGARALSSVSANGLEGVGLENTAVGRNALVDNTEGSSNIAVGDGTLKYVTTGSNNIAIGAGAGEDLGEGTATVGNDNIFIGHPGMPKDSGVIRIGEFGTHYTTSIAGAAVGLGLYGNAPTTRLHVQGTKSGPATEINHVVLIENLLGSGSADVLALKIHESEGDIGSSNNFISFKDSGGNNIGSIEGNGNGIDLNTMGGDFAEYLPKARSAEDLPPGAVVGLDSGTVSLATEGSERALVVTTSPAVLGNDPGLGERGDYVPVAFLGQVPVRVRGLVEPGDLLVPSGRADGYAVALSDQTRDPSAFARIVGRTLEGSEGREGTVKTTVGLPDAEPLIALLAEQRREIQRQREDMAALRERLNALENAQPAPREKKKR